MNRNDKQCPFCGERININALKCKHCGEWLDQTYQYHNNQSQTQVNSCGCLSIVWKTIVVVVTILIVLALLPVIGDILMLFVLQQGATP